MPGREVDESGRSLGRPHTVLAVELPFLFQQRSRDS